MADRIRPRADRPGIPRAAARAARGRRAGPGPGARCRARRRAGGADRGAVGRAARRRRHGCRRLLDRGARGAGARRRHVGFRLARRAHPRAGRGDGASGPSGGPRAGAARPRAGRPCRRAGVRRGRVVSDYLVDPFAVPTGDKVALLADRSRRLLAADGVDHVEAGLAVVQENKFYADTAGTSTLQQRVRTAAVAHRDDRRPRRRRVRDDAHARPAGGPRLGVPHRDRLGLGRRAGPVARAAGREGEGARRSSRAGTTW